MKVSRLTHQELTFLSFLLKKLENQLVEDEQGVGWVTRTQLDVTMYLREGFNPDGTPEGA